MATVRQRVREIKSRLVKVKRSATAELSGRVIRRTPVDTGRLRQSWTPSIGRPDFSNKGGSIALVTKRLKTGDVYYLSNGQPYARRIEYGYSRHQAPRGMVRISVAEWPSIVNQAARQVAA